MPPRLHTGLYLRGAIALAVLAAASAIGLAAALRPGLLATRPADLLAGLLTPRRSVAQLAARPEDEGQVVDLDAYVSSPGNALCAGEQRTILADQPFAAELAVLGSAEGNVLPGDVPWLLVAGPDGVQLPYHARFRGRLGAPTAAGECPASVRLFTVEKVVRVYEQRPPTAEAGAAPTSWPRYQNAAATYSLPQPPGWQVERLDDTAVALSAPQYPASPITLRVHPGETHHDPYEPEPAPPLLQGRRWSIFEQAAAGAASQGLVGYRVAGEAQAGERSVAVLFSGNGRTYELSVRYQLGFAVSQPLLDAYAAVVAGFRFDAPLAPSPTPPVRQALGAGPLMDDEQALQAACGCLRQEIEAVLAQQLVPEAEARRFGGPCDAFRGHNDGVWALTLKTPLATRTGTLRLLLDATTGRELCREEVEPGAVPTATPSEAAAASKSPRRWIEVDLSRQMVVAWEGDTPVREFNVSTGTASHPTLPGSYSIYYKTKTMDMGGEGYFLPDVPWVMLFFEGYALHGAYWHFSFGTPVSHGCVNMTIPDAAWLFEWAGPRLAADEWAVTATPCNPGTPVQVHD